MNLITKNPSFESTAEWIKTKGGKMISLGERRVEKEDRERGTEAGPMISDVSETTPLERRNED